MTLPIANCRFPTGVLAQFETENPNELSSISIKYHPAIFRFADLPIGVLAQFETENPNQLSSISIKYHPAIFRFADCQLPIANWLLSCLNRVS